MPRESRVSLVSRITEAISNYGPMMLSEISKAVRTNPETVKSCVRTLVRSGLLSVTPEPRMTSTGPAKIYDLREVDKVWQQKIMAEEADSPVVRALDMWAACALKRDLESISEEDRTIFWLIESSIKSMPAHQAIALLHVHGCSIWAFRKMDMADVYRDALAAVTRRLESMLGG